MRRLIVFLFAGLLLIPFTANAETESLEMRVDMKQPVTEGEIIPFRVDLYNTSDEAVTLNFSSSIQMEYKIGDYSYFESHSFTDPLSEITIPAKGVHSWEFEHSLGDMKVDAGVHILEVELLDYDLIHEYKFEVLRAQSYLPEDLSLSLALSQRSYNPGDYIEFTLSVTNNGDSDITIPINPVTPVTFALMSETPLPVYDGTTVLRGYDEAIDSRQPEFVDTLVPAGEAISWEHTIMQERLLMGGTYTLRAGLYGFEDIATAEVMIQNVELVGTIKGTVSMLKKYDDVPQQLAGATVVLYAFNSGEPDRTYDSFAPYPIAEKFITTTGDDGAFMFENVEIGLNYSLEITEPGFYSYMTSFFMDRYEMTVYAHLKEEYNEGPVNYTKLRTGPLGITFGTDKSVYKPGDAIYAFFDIFNYGDDTVTLEYGDSIVTWSVIDENGVTVWSDTSYVLNQPVNSNMFDVYLSTAEEISPLGGTHFTYKWHIEELLGDTSGAFTFAASLDYTSSSNPDLTPGDVIVKIPILVADTVSAEIAVSTTDKKFTAEVRNDVQVLIDIDLKQDVDDFLNISEIRENHLDPLKNHNFIKMVDINAGVDIRNNLERAMLRIYFDSEDFADPENIVIAHWLDAEKRWETLETNISETYGFAEAYTNSFSWFGLFEDISTAVDEISPHAFTLIQNSPNPFNPSTVIRFSLPQSGTTRLDVFNMAGQNVATLLNTDMSAGTHSIIFDAGTLSTGVYFYRLKSGQLTQTRRMLLIK